MKKRVTKLIAALGMILACTTVSAETAMAAAHVNFSAYYEQGVPPSAANPTTYVDLPYDAGGFYAICTRLTGSYDRMVTITSTSAGGMTPVQITVENKKTSVWKMYGSTTGNVTFKVHATGGTSCGANGTIYQAL